MFKGFTESLKSRLEEYNQNSENFVFCVSDLEHSPDNEAGENKFDIHSAELRQKLGSLVNSNGGTMPSPTKVVFLKFPSLFEGKIGIKSFNFWIVVNKKRLIELNQSNSNRVIKLPIKERIKDGIYVTYLLIANFLETSNSSKRLELNKNEEEKEKEHNKKTRDAKNGAFKQISDALLKSRIDIETAEIFWPGILPDWCHCEVKETDNPENNKLYESHIISCLWRGENEINDFKDKVLTAIESGNKRFDGHKNLVIQKIIHQANSQGISEIELNNNRHNWQNHLRYLKNKKDIIDYQTKQLEKDIQILSSAKKKTAEEHQQAEVQARKINTADITNMTNKELLISRIKKGIAEEKRLVGKIIGQVKSAKKDPKFRLNIDEKQLWARLNEVIKSWEERKVPKIINQFLEEITDSLRKKEDILLWGYFSLKVRRSLSRKARNPQTGELLTIEPKNRISFRASSKLKKKIN